jgi:hypothetical protein
MKDLYKNPLFYYILVPLIIALWPLLVCFISLPKAQRSWNLEKEQYNKAQQTVTDILTIAPERLDFANAKKTAAEFDYAVAVEKVANLCGIPSTGYKLSSGSIVTSGGRKSQNAKVDLKQIEIVKCTKFLSLMQLHWQNLQCTQLKLDKRKGLPDIWDIALDFKYYF